MLASRLARRQQHARQSHAGGCLRGLDHRHAQCVFQRRAVLRHAGTAHHDDVRAVFFDAKGAKVAEVSDVFHKHTDVNQLLGKGDFTFQFYDKDGKQLDVKADPASTTAKALPFLTCPGSSLFSGIMKVKEKATITFSCVKKANVPEGATAIEGELLTVGFADASDKKVDFYWSNKELAPSERPKGGAK